MRHIVSTNGFNKPSPAVSTNGAERQLILGVYNRHCSRAYYLYGKRNFSYLRAES